MQATKALDTVLLDRDFKFDHQCNFRTLDPLRNPQTEKWMEVGYDKTRAVLNELGVLQ